MRLLVFLSQLSERDLVDMSGWMAVSFKKDDPNDIDLLVFYYPKDIQNWTQASV